MSTFHRCPLCSGTTNLIYGTHTAPQGCELCSLYRNKSAFDQIQVDMHNTWCQEVLRLAAEFAVKINKDRKAS